MNSEVAKSMFGSGYEEEIQKYVNYVFEQYDDDHSGALDKEGKFRKKVSIHFFS